MSVDPRDAVGRHTHPALDALKHVERLQVVDVRPGDVIVAHVERHALPPNKIRQIGRVLDGLFPDQRVIVDDAGVDLKAYRPLEDEKP